MEQPKQTLESMEVCNCSWDCVSEQEYTEQQWNELKTRACFVHAREAELIFYIGKHADNYNPVLNHTPLESLSIKAQDEGFKYLCFYC